QRQFVGIFDSAHRREVLVERRHGGDLADRLRVAGGDVSHLDANASSTQASPGNRLAESHRAQRVDVGHFVDGTARGIVADRVESLDETFLKPLAAAWSDDEHRVGTDDRERWSLEAGGVTS